jgi:hypothetical protein
VGVWIVFRWLVDLVAVSSWCRPQPPSSNPIVHHCRRFLVVPPTESLASIIGSRNCVPWDARFGRVAVVQSLVAIEQRVCLPWSTNCLPNSLVTCHANSPCVSVVPRAWDPDQSRQASLGRHCPRPVGTCLSGCLLVLVSLPGGLPSARSRVSGLGSAPDCFYLRIRVGYGHRVSSPLTSNDPIGFHEL